MSESENGDFWKSLEGIITRVADLAHNFTWGSLAETVKGVFEATPQGQVLVWNEVGDGRVCELCVAAEAENPYQETEALLPDIPLHVNCRCYWSVEWAEDWGFD